jgi:hypothetical protein
MPNTPGHLQRLANSQRRANDLRNDDKCQCGAKETVVHVLVDCPRLINLRQQLRRKIGEAFNEISAMLGGKGLARAGQGKGGNVHYILNAVLLDVQRPITQHGLPTRIWATYGLDCPVEVEMLPIHLFPGYELVMVKHFACT